MNPNPQLLHHRRRAAGFTLIELMIACAVLAILAAIAIASYLSQVQQAHRTDAKNALLDLAAREERYFATNNAYTSSAAALGYSAVPFNVPVDASSPSYQVSFVALTASSYTALATRQNGQGSDACGDYSLTDAGLEQNANGSLPSASCW